MNTITCCITIRPSQVSVEHGTRIIIAGSPSVFELDGWKSNRMSPRTHSVTNILARIRHMGSIGLVKIVAVPARGEEELRLQAIRTISIEVEVISDKGISKAILYLTSKGGEIRGSLVEGVSHKHSETLWERDDGFSS